MLLSAVENQSQKDAGWLDQQRPAERQAFLRSIPAEEVSFSRGLAGRLPLGYIRRTSNCHKRSEELSHSLQQHSALRSPVRAEAPPSNCCRILTNCTVWDAAILTHPPSKPFRLRSTTAAVVEALWFRPAQAKRFPAPSTRRSFLLSEKTSKVFPLRGSRLCQSPSPSPSSPVHSSHPVSPPGISSIPLSKQRVRTGTLTVRERLLLKSLETGSQDV